MIRAQTLLAVLVVSLLCGCAPLSRYEVRPARSSLGCMRSVLRMHEPTPAHDAQAHCLAAGLIARYCSISEAWLAGIGKEIRDLFGPGQAEWRDLVADRRGIDCARRVTDDAGLQVCCEEAAHAPLIGRQPDHYVIHQVSLSLVADVVPFARQ